MIILTSEQLEEYQGELRLLTEEEKELDEVYQRVKSSRDEIRGRIKEIAEVLGGTQERVVIDAGPPGGWDRTVRVKGAGMDVAKLEEVLGTTKFRRLACIRTVSYVPSLDKINASRQEGKIKEADLNKSMTEGTASFALRRLSPTQVEKIKAKGGQGQC